jgi:PAS domain S-box-containing protein
MIETATISKIALVFLTNEDFDTQLSEALAIMGTELGVSRSYLFVDSPDGATTSNTHEWCAPGIEPQITKLQDIPYAGLPGWKALLEREGVFAIDDVAHLSDDMRKILEPQGIRSLLLAPFRVEGNAIGFLGFDECTHSRSWNGLEIDTLETILGIVATAYVKHRLTVRLAITEENFRSFFDAVDEIIVVADLEGRIIFANAGATNKLGYSLEALCGMHVLDMHPPEKRTEATAILTSMFTKERTSCPLELGTRDGRRLPVETRIWFGHWDGKACIFGLSKDLSVEQAALQKFEKLFQSNPAAMAVSRVTDNAFVDVNAALLEKLGYTREEIIGHTSQELNLFVVDDARWRRARGELFHTGSIRDHQIMVRRKDGRLLDGLFSGDVIDRQGEQFFLTVMVDITEQMRLQEALASQRQRLMNVIEGTQLGTWEWNMQTGEIIVNERWAAMLGYSLAELAPTTIETRLRLAHPDDLVESTRQFDRHFEGLTDYYECEVRLRHQNGSWVWVQDRGKIIERDSQGHPLKMYGTHTDITRLKEAEEGLKAAKDAANAANMAKSLFLANMSHEIRTPMNVILGYAHLLKKASVAPEPRERLQHIEDASKHLLAIINDILDISKIEAGKLVLEQTSFQLDLLMEYVRSLIAEAAAAKGLTVTLDYDAVPILLCGDPTRLRQALLNFAGNAVKFTDRGSITLRAILLEQQVENLLMRFEVQDTGPGIPLESQQELFKSFKQVDASTTRRHGGTGLGLAITKRLAQLMGGEAGVESVPGAGSLFWFSTWLKLSDSSLMEKAPSSEFPEAEIRRHHAGVRILLAEDDRINQKVALAMLAQTGLLVDVADNGRQAVERAAMTDYALILMDLQMPEMGGLEATDIIRGIPDRGRTPIIAMTANAFEEDRDQCIEAGMNDFLAKPVDPEVLYQTLLLWLGRHGKE